MAEDISTPIGGSTELKPAFEKKDAQLHVVGKTSVDKMELYLDIVRLDKESPTPVDKEKLLAHLAAVPQNLLFAESLDAIVTDLNQGRPVAKRLIAKGTPAANGRDGKVLFLVKVYDNQKKDAEIDFVDPKFIRNFDNVEKGNCVARIYPPVIGSDGLDVTGKILKATVGKPAKVKYEKTLSRLPFSPEMPFESLVAEQAGFVTEEKGALTVKSELVLDGINFKTGDIDFVGSVLIKGDVVKGFHVNARGDITVQGDVFQSSLISRTGSITVKGSIMGGGNQIVQATGGVNTAMLKGLGGDDAPQIQCAKTFTATMVDGVSADAGGDIVIEREARNSMLHTKAILRMPAAHLVGGEVYSVCGVEAKIMGTQAGGKTKIFLCSDVESTSEYGELTEKIDQCAGAIELLKTQLGPFAEHHEKVEGLAADLRAKIQEFIDTLGQVESTLNELEAERKTLLSTARSNMNFRANFLSMLHEGVVICSGKKCMTIADNKPGPGTVEYFPEKKSFEVSPLRALECTVGEGESCKLPA